MDENNNSGETKNLNGPSPTSADSLGSLSPDGKVEHVGEHSDILPWNIIEDPPETNKKELYPIEGSWRLVSNHVR